MDGGARKRSAKGKKGCRPELLAKLRVLHYLPSSFEDQVPDGDRDDSEKPARDPLPNSVAQSRLTLPQNSSMFGGAIHSSICRRNIAENVKEDSQRPGDLQRVVEIGNRKMKKRLLTAYNGKPVKPQSRRAHQPRLGIQQDFLPLPADTIQQGKKRPSSATQQQQRHRHSSYRPPSPQPPQQCASTSSTSTNRSATQLPRSSTAAAVTVAKNRFKSIDQSNGRPSMHTPVVSYSPSTVLKSYLAVTPSPPVISSNSNQGNEVLDFPQLDRMTHTLLDRLGQMHGRFRDTVTAMQTERRNYFGPILAQIKGRQLQQRNLKKDETKGKRVREASSLPASAEHVSQSMEWRINDPRLASPSPARAVTFGGVGQKARETQRAEFAFKPTSMGHNGLSVELAKDWHSDAFSLFQSPSQFLWRTGDHAQPSGKPGRRVVFEDQLRPRRETTFLDGHSGITKPIDSFVYHRHSTSAPCVDSTRANCSSDADLTSLFANVSRNRLGPREASRDHTSQAVRLNSLPPPNQAFFYPGECVTSATQSIFDHRRHRSMSVAKSTYVAPYESISFVDRRRSGESERILDFLTSSPPRTYSETRLF